MLYRISGSTEQIAPDFDDVDPGEYYYYPIGWAQDYGIVYGLTETEFGPEVSITREQLITIVYRYIREYEGIYHTKTNLSANSKHYANWADASSLSDYSKEAVDWAANCGILSTATNFAFQPGSVASRGVCARYLHAFMELAFGNAKVYTMTDAVSSEDCNDEIVEYLNSTSIADYDCNQWIDAEGPHVEFGFYNSELVMVDCHGEANYIMWDNMGSMRTLHENYIKDGAMADVELAYISACNAGQSFCRVLWEEGGAQNVVGFKTPITYLSDNDNVGAMLFNRLFFQSYTSGETLTDSSIDALVGLYNRTGKYSGCDSIIIYPDPYEV